MDFNTEIAQRLAQDAYSCDWPEALRIATGREADPNTIAQSLYVGDINDNAVQLYSLLDGHSLYLPGSGSSFISTPDAASLDLSGDFSLRIEYVILGSTGGNQGLIAKYGGAGQRSYQLLAGVFGTMETVVSTDGTATTNVGSVTIPSTPAYRLDLDADDGSTNRVGTHYSAPSLDGPWTQIDQDTQSGTVSIFNSTAALVLGSATSSGGSFFNGLIKRAEVRDELDAVVANPDFRGLAPGTTSFDDAAGNTWTLQGSAEVR